jgi:hypothetical protein
MNLECPRQTPGPSEASCMGNFRHRQPVGVARGVTLLLVFQSLESPDTVDLRKQHRLKVALARVVR